MADVPKHPRHRPQLGLPLELFLKIFGGHARLTPVQFSAISHNPACARHNVPATAGVLFVHVPKTHFSCVQGFPSLAQLESFKHCTQLAAPTQYGVAPEHVDIVTTPNNGPCVPPEPSHAVLFCTILFPLQ